ncbi:MAG: peptide ABC transporter substrate-binding protein [Alphaproteobacteria bacterium PA3]|nr:MAG: peptide ABC transporter substrate-binding protein [Alphaproteobacteria bacterium PA3]
MTNKILALLALLLVAAGCGNTTEGSDKATSLRMGNAGEPLTLDPARATIVTEDRILESLFEGLTVLNPAAKPVPGVAESWLVSEDKLTWTFKLRDAKWSDGTPVTAEDFVYSIRRLMDPKTRSNYASLFYMIKNSEAVNSKGAPLTSLGVTAPDAKTLVIELTNPTPFLPVLMSHWLVYPVPRHVIDKFGDEWVKPGNLVGNGAFVLKEWRPNDFIRLEKNPQFHDAANICLTDLLIFPTTDPAAAARSVRAGELDTNATFAGQTREVLSKELPGYVREAPYALIQYELFNLKNPKLKDARVRQALSLAIDRELIASKIIGGASKPAFSIVPPDTLGYNGGPVAGMFEADLATRLASARALLIAAGYGPNKPLSLTLKHVTNGDTPRYVPILQNTWQQIAPWVKIDLLGADGQIHYSQVQRGDFELANMGWYADYDDAKSFLYILESRSGEMNSGRYENPTYDGLLAKADQERDEVERAKLLRTAEELAVKDAALAPVFFDTGRSLVNPRVTGWVDNKLNTHRTRWLCTKEAEAKRKQATP